MDTYKIIRYKQGRHQENVVLYTGLTLEQVREHCNNPETSGPDWFDGFTKEESGEVE